MIEKNEWERRMNGRQLGNREMSGISNNKVAEEWKDSWWQR